MWAASFKKRALHQLSRHNHSTLVKLTHDKQEAASKDINEFEYIHSKDLAFVKAPELLKNYPGLKLDFEYLPQPGERIKALGFADGNDTAVCVDAMVTGYSSNKERVDVDRPFIAGMSGGPILNTRGNVIGYVVNGSKRDNYFYDGAFVPLRSLRVTRFAKMCGYNK